MSTEFDPKKIINFEKDYYEILAIDKHSFPSGNNRNDVISRTKILEDAFRKCARKAHPDFGGSEEQFLDLVRARRILEDSILRKIYDSGEFVEFNFGETSDESFAVDWTKIGTYRKGTPEDTIGFSLFLKLCEKKEELGLIPAFYPTSNEHNYQWDFVIKDSTKNKLVISIVNDENEVLRLTNSDEIQNSLPFKIYICIPESSLVFSRDNNKILDPFGKTLINGNILSANYNDLDLLESTNLNSTNEYLENKLPSNIVSFLNGELKSKKVSNQKKWMSSEELKELDKEKLREIVNFKSFEIADIPNADSWVDSIDKKPIKRLVNVKPELPL
jgi:curved DNA-binding protein CbpA